jgi:hypothetical protein
VEAVSEHLTLTGFLLARIAEDEAAARAATSGPWRYDHSENRWSLGGSGEDAGIAHASWEGGDGTGADLTHIARHDPARVLAEVEAKLRIVENTIAAARVASESPPEEQISASDGPMVAYWRGQDWVCKTLAAVYADHPDYRDEWRP